MKITILGSGTSHGVPVIGCSCPVCRSEDPRDKRMRASLLLEGPGGEAALVDAGPEFRLQALRAHITRLDAVFLTHAHADHLHGLDDLRPLSAAGPIPIYCSGPTLQELRERFSYVFRETQAGGGKPRIEPRELRGPLSLGRLRFIPLPVKHGNLDIYGWKVTEGGGPEAPGGLVYLTDCSSIPGETKKLIQKPELLVIGAIRVRPHSTHFSFGEAFEAARELGARRVLLTHLCHDHSHQETQALCRDFIEKNRLPQGTDFAPAWDGLETALA